MGMPVYQDPRSGIWYDNQGQMVPPPPMGAPGQQSRFQQFSEPINNWLNTNGPQALQNYGNATNPVTSSGNAWNWLFGPQSPQQQGGPLTQEQINARLRQSTNNKLPTINQSTPTNTSQVGISQTDEPRPTPGYSPGNTSVMNTPYPTQEQIFQALQQGRITQREWEDYRGDGVIPAYFGNQMNIDQSTQPSSANTSIQPSGGSNTPEKPNQGSEQFPEGIRGWAMAYKAEHGYFPGQAPHDIGWDRQANPYQSNQSASQFPKQFTEQGDVWPFMQQARDYMYQQSPDFREGTNQQGYGADLAAQAWGNQFYDLNKRAPNMDEWNWRYYNSEGQDPKWLTR